MSIRSDGYNVLKFIHFHPAKPSDEITRRMAEVARLVPEKMTTAPNTAAKRIRYLAARRDLGRIDLSRDVVTDPSAGEARFLTFTEHGLKRLSDATRDVLDEAGIDPQGSAHHEIRDLLDHLLVDLADPATHFTEGSGAPADVPVGKLQAVGTADLLVVKQHVKRYEADEIAHIENVLSGETKARHHKVLTRTEETITTTSDVTRESEESLETTERFELDKQTEKVFERETELGAELSLSGKYGPTVSFESNFSAGQTTSESASTSHAVGFARETIERSRERVVERIVSERKQTLIREILETEDHTQENAGDEHRVGIYQYVDKVYESQVFDYGRRQMFDFMLPEPASFFWYLRQNKAMKTDHQAPRKLEEMDIHSARDIARYNYLALGAAYGVDDLPPPPEIRITRRLRLAHGDGSTSDTGKHKSGVSGEIDIPPCYVPIRVYPTILATSDETLSLSINIGGTILNFPKAEFDELTFGGGHRRFTFDSAVGFWVITPQSDLKIAGEEKLHVDVFAYETANYSIQIEVEFYASYDQAAGEHHVVTAWQKQVHGLLSDAYRNALYVWRQDRAAEEAERAATTRSTTDFAAPPATVRKMIADELKKHAIAIIRNSHPGDLATPHAGEPPQFSIGDALRDGQVVRFLEHAFEWGQMQYVFYPYYWARPKDDCSGWTDRALSSNPSYTMEEFLKAGYARVVVPVREGFDRAVSYFITEGEVYGGEGEPDVTDPLYISIVDEIRDRADVGKDEIPVGALWETRVPTAAVIVRRSETLPSWSRPDPDEWTWEPNA